MRRSLIAALVPVVALTAGDPRALAREAEPTSTVVGEVRGAAGPVEAQVQALRVGDVVSIPEFRSGWSPLLARSAFRLPPDALTDGAVAAQARAGRDGRFRLAGLVPGEYRLRATTPLGESGAVGLTVPVPGALIESDVVIGVPRSAVVSGRVRHADGRPFRGRVAPFSIGMFLEATAAGVRTDGRGCFELEAEVPATGGLDLWVGAVDPGRSVVVWPIGTQRSGLDLVVDEGVRAVRGRAVQEGSGRSLPGAEALLLCPGGPDGVRRVERVTADADGEFLLTLVDEGSRGVVVEAEGHAAVWAEIPPGRLATVAVPPLPLAGRVRGRVTRSGEGPLPEDLRVFAWLAPPGPTVDVGLAAAPVGPDGRFDLGAFIPSQAMVYAAGDGWLSQGTSEYVRGSAAALPRVAVPPGGVVEVEVPLVRAGAVRGRVTGPDGAALEGALVRVAIVHGVVPDAAEYVGDAPVGMSGRADHAATRGDGTYELRSLIPGIPYRVEVAYPGLAPTASATVRVASGGAATVDLRLAERGSRRVGR